MSSQTQPDPQHLETLLQEMKQIHREHRWNSDLPEETRDRFLGLTFIPGGDENQAAWAAQVTTLIGEVNAALAAVDHEAKAARLLTELRDKARAIRDEANRILAEDRQYLNDGWYDRLVELDVDDDALPADETGLSQWIYRNQFAPSLARDNAAGNWHEEAVIKQQRKDGVPSSKLAALAAKLNKK